MKIKIDGFIQFIVAVIIATLTTLGGAAFYASNYATLSDLDKLKVLKVNQNFGTTLTNITSATKISDLATILPNNFNELDRMKIEVSTTTLPKITTLAGLTSASSLATIGTITTGVWNGTAIPVSKGGTGTTSPTIYMTMLGNGSLGLTHASSTGTTGQFLTSNGAGAYPSWQTASVNQTSDYNFTSSYFGVKNLNASSTAANPIYLNGIDFNTPSVEGASSTILATNGSGTLTWDTYSKRVYTNVTPVTVASSAATTTLETFVLPAGLLGTQNILRVVLNVSNFRITQTKGALFSFAYGSTSTSTTIYSDAGDTTNQSGTITFELMGAGATNSQKGEFHLSTQLKGVAIDLATPSGSGLSIDVVDTATYAIDSTADQSITLRIQFTNSAATDNITVDNAYAYIIR